MMQKHGYHVNCYNTEQLKLFPVSHSWHQQYPQQHFNHSNWCEKHLIVACCLILAILVECILHWLTRWGWNRGEWWVNNLLNWQQSINNKSMEEPTVYSVCSLRGSACDVKIRLIVYIQFTQNKLTTNFLYIRAKHLVGLWRDVSHCEIDQI